MKVEGRKGHFILENWVLILLLKYETLRKYTRAAKFFKKFDVKLTFSRLQIKCTE